MAKVIREQKNFKGNREHLDIILYAVKKSDIGFWNTWRDKHCDVKISLAGANLSNTVLTGVNFECVNLREANLSGAELSGVNLTGADLRGTDFSEASLINAELNKALLNGTYFYEANLTGAKCRETNFTNAILCKTSLRKANLDLAVINSSDLTGSDLRNCSLARATLDNVIFTGANVYGWNIKDWKTKKLKCEYIYIDIKGKERLPKSRNFRAGEFEGYIKKIKISKEIRKSKLPEGRALNHIFISYVKEDYEYVINLANALELKGIKVWLDKERLQPGIQWQKAMQNAIEDGAYFIACFSKNYCKKLDTSINEELKIVIERLQKVQDDRVWFIPIKILRCEIPDKKIGAGRSLTDLQWIDFTKGWNEGIKRVVGMIKG